MKLFYVLFLISIGISCKQTETVSVERIDETDTPSSQKMVAAEKNDTCWLGTLQGNIPIFIHYQKADDILAGEIFYMSSEDKHPIKLIGTISKENQYRLLEFDSKGNITGIITGMPKGNIFNGIWFSPKTRKTLEMKLFSKDTAIHSVNIVPDISDISGDYHYQYEEDGPAGLFTIYNIENNQAWFQLNAVTSFPARNMADIPRDTINFISNTFQYDLPNTKDCSIAITFYKGFARTHYTKGDCSRQFGNNATAEGIFIKQ